MNVERHSWCAGVLSLSRPGALCGIRAGSQGPGGGRRRGVWRVCWRVCARAGQTRIGGTGGSNPDRERARSKPDREHGRVKSETGEAPPRRKKTKKEKKKKGTCGFNHTGRVATTAVITGLTTTRGYNRSWNCGPRGCGCNQSLNLDRVSGAEIGFLTSASGSNSAQLWYHSTWLRDCSCQPTMYTFLSACI